MNHSSDFVFFCFIQIQCRSARQFFLFDDHLSEVATTFLYMFLKKKNILPKPCVDDDEAQVESSAGEDRADIKSVCVSLLSLCPAVLRRWFKKKEKKKKGEKNWRSMCL